MNIINLVQLLLLFTSTVSVEAATGLYVLGTKGKKENGCPAGYSAIYSGIECRDALKHLDFRYTLVIPIDDHACFVHRDMGYNDDAWLEDRPDATWVCGRDDHTPIFTLPPIAADGLYVLGAKGKKESGCPTGYSAVYNGMQCRDAMQYLDLSYSILTYSNAYACFVDSDTIGYNSDVKNGLDAKYICGKDGHILSPTEFPSIAPTSKPSVAPTSKPKARCTWSVDTTRGSISGHNLATFEGLTVQQCQQKCNENSACKSIDINFIGRCNLGDCQIGDGTCTNDHSFTWNYYACIEGCPENAREVDGSCYCLSNGALTSDGSECELPIETVDVVVEVTGVTDSNKDLVCDGFAKAVGGGVSYCSLSEPNTKRRRLTTSLYIDITVSDARVAVATMRGEKFVEKVSLPSEVKATTLTAKTKTSKASRCTWNADATYGSISGHNLATFEGITLEGCKQKCNENSACKSIDYQVLHLLGKCNLGGCQIGDGTCANDQAFGWTYYACIEDNGKVCPPNSIKKNGQCFCKFDRTLLASGTNCLDSSPVQNATYQQAVNMCFMAVLLLLGFLI